MSFLFPHSSKRAGSVQLSSKEQWLYDELWKQANSQGAAVVSSVPAVEFLNKSGISPFSLAAVWQITALNERGQDYFDRDAFNAALRLIGHVQAGKAPSAALLSVEAPLPNFNLINPKYTAAAATAEASTSPRNMTSGIPAMAWPPMPASEMKSYRELFRSLDKENGLLRGEIVLQIVNKSQLPTGTLAKILALVDRNSRAALDEDEFVMAMYLVMCLKKNAIVALPPALPAEVMEICSVKAGGGANTGRQTSPLPNDANNNIYSALGLDYNSTTERERQLLAMLQTQQQQREKVQEAYLAQMLENSRVAEERLYKQQMEQNKTMKDQIAPMIAQYQLQRMQAAQQELAPLMSSTALGSGRYADIFAEGYNNAMKQQQELFERMSAANQPLGTAAPPTPNSNSPNTPSTSSSPIRLTLHSSSNSNLTSHLDTLCRLTPSRNSTIRTLSIPRVDPLLQFKRGWHPCQGTSPTNHHPKATPNTNSLRQVSHNNPYHQETHSRRPYRRETRNSNPCRLGIHNTRLTMSNNNIFISNNQ
ncbi:hypothetical protein BGX33_001804 [Mortierella sp. NVP41]|nr:hypothetical protein BGX33_001804 [Mortierella sp. NVP41]